MPALSIDTKHLDLVAKLVYDNSGIVFKDSNLSVLISRLSTKLKEKEMEAEKYIQTLQIDKDELLSFIDFVTTNFTSFFRNTRHFDIFENVVLPDLVEKNKINKNIRIWSAGSSTGEEAYTIAIVIHEFFQKKKIIISDWNIEIVGSDISLESLFIAKEAKYPERSLKKVDPYFVQNYFREENGGQYYSVNENIRKMVKFDFHNLIYDANVDHVDVTFCRNVLIYFDSEIQRKVLEKIHKAMKPHSWLFIGHSESLTGLYDGFKIQNLKEGIVYARQ